MKEGKGKHLTFEDRIEIQECLNYGMTFKAIGERLQKDQTTISKEVKRHIKVHTNSFVKREDCCPKLLKAPFVCNGCKNRSRSSCRYERHVYEAKAAQTEYETSLTESRKGVALNKESFYKTEEIISNGVKSGQHIYHILQTHKLDVSSASVYRYIHLYGLGAFRNIAQGQIIMPGDNAINRKLAELAHGGAITRKIHHQRGALGDGAV